MPLPGRSDILRRPAIFRTYRFIRYGPFTRRADPTPARDELDAVSETTEHDGHHGLNPMMPAVLSIRVVRGLSVACYLWPVLSVAQKENRIAPCMTRALRERRRLAEARVDLLARRIELRVRVERRPVHLVEHVVGLPPELDPLAAAELEVLEEGHVRQDDLRQPEERHAARCRCRRGRSAG